MTLSELIAHVGDENIELQWLHQGNADLNIGKRDGNVKFYTGIDKVNSLMHSNSQFFGVVLWLPREKMPESFKGIKYEVEI